MMVSGCGVSRLGQFYQLELLFSLSNYSRRCRHSAVANSSTIASSVGVSLHRILLLLLSMLISVLFERI